MKSTYLFVLLLFALNSSAQEISTDSIVPVKGNNLIRFHADSLLDYELFGQCLLALRELRYSFEDLDNDFYWCKTKPLEYENSFLRIDLSVSKNIVEIRSYVKLKGGTSITIPGTYATMESEHGWERGANRSLKTSLWMHGWNNQIEIADILRKKVQEQIEYITEK